MKNLMSFMTAAFVAATCVLSTGCLVTSRPAHGESHHHVKSRDQRSKKPRRACHPSQYWDGHTCRHKGRGHGARKHDGR